MRKIIVRLLFVVVVGSMVSSCKKDCVIEEKDNYSGDILTNAVVYTNHGIITSKFPDSTFVVDSLTDPTVRGYFSVRFDQGEELPIDFSKYNVMGYPTNTDCSSVFDRNVTINNASQSVNYTIKITRCDDCEGDYTAENWVLVPVFPNNYTVTHDVVVVDKSK